MTTLTPRIVTYAFHISFIRPRLWVLLAQNDPH